MDILLGSLTTTVALLTLFQIAGGLDSFWADSEMWAVSSAGELLSHTGKFSFGIKPLFNLILFVSDQIARIGAWPAMDVARFLFAINSIVIVALLYRLVKNLSGSFKRALLAVGLLATSILFVKRGYRVRSDLVVTTLHLWMLIFLIRWVPENRSEKCPRSFKVICCLALFSLLEMWATPNAIVLILASLPFYVEIFRRLSMGDCVDAFKKLSGRWIAGLILVTIAFAFYAWRLSWISGSVAALAFFIHSFSAAQSGPPYWSWVRFEYITQFVKQDILFSLAIAVSIPIFVYRWLTEKEIGSYTKSLILSGFILLVLLLLHPNKMPFMIVSYLPFFAMAIVLAVPDFSRLPDKTKSSFALIVILIFLFQARRALKEYWVIHKMHTHHTQSAVINYMNSYLHHFRNPTYYDVIGILPDYPPTDNFVGPGQSKANNISGYFVKQTKPDFIFFVQKMSAIAWIVVPVLKKYYFSAGHGIYVLGENFQIKNLQVRQGCVRTQGLLKLVRKHFHFATNNSILPVLAFYKANGVILNSPIQIVEKRRKLFLPPDPDLKILENPDACLKIPRKAVSLRFSPFGLPNPPTTSSMMQLFRFDAGF